MNSKTNLDSFAGCQIPCLPRLAEGNAKMDPDGWKITIKRSLAKPWNQLVKKSVKHFYRWMESSTMNPEKAAMEGVKIKTEPLVAGDWVHVKSREEIEETLDRWKEFKGCAFLEYMSQYCGTDQRVLQPLERFLDERDYKVKKCRGVVLLENVICRGTPVFGRCDRCCYLFWREEWLEKIPVPFAKS